MIWMNERMYHFVDLYQDVKADVKSHYGGSLWAAYTPFPFMYSLSQKASNTIRRKTPKIIRNTAVWTRDKMVELGGRTQDKAHQLTGQVVHLTGHCYQVVKRTVVTAPVPKALVPVRARYVVPIFTTVEDFVHIWSNTEEIDELYLVVKARISENFIGHHVVIPALTTVERMTKFMIILPTRFVFPSREQVASGTDNFLDVSRTSLQSMVQRVYSATEVIEQHLTMAKWNILGRGPYASLHDDKRLEIVKGVHQRRLFITSYYRMYEFMSSIRIHNEMLYNDLLEMHPNSGGTPLDKQTFQSEHLDVFEQLQDLNATTFPCWFFKPSIEGEWKQFQDYEMRRIERAYQKWIRSPLNEKEKYRHVPVDEGRHDICLQTMTLNPVYWPRVEVINIRRSVWLYADRTYGLKPYEEEACEILENAFAYFLTFAEMEEKIQREAFIEAYPRKRLNLPPRTLTVPVDGHLVEFRSMYEIVQLKNLLAGTTAFTSKRRVYRGDPRLRNDVEKTDIWKRIMTDANELDASEKDNQDISQPVEHVVFLVHGIGDALRSVDFNVVQLRSIIQCAETLRESHRQAVNSPHFEHIPEAGKCRVEFLPIEWHTKLHYEDNISDRNIRNITLPAIPKLREFANDTILDVLFFLAPRYHQLIMDEVACELNQVYAKFCARNPLYTGKVSLIGHSLGAIICFDILSNQRIPTSYKTDAVRDPVPSKTISLSVADVKASSPSSPYMLELDSSTRDEALVQKADLSYCKTVYPPLTFEVENLFTYGSPIGMFINVRGQHLTSDFKLPTCQHFFNIFHPYDPVAYRLEPLISPWRKLHKPAIIPTFAGGLRYQYHLKKKVKSFWNDIWTWKTRVENRMENVAEKLGLLEDEEDEEEDEEEDHEDVDEAEVGHDVKSTGSPSPRRPRAGSSNFIEKMSKNVEGNYKEYGNLNHGLPVDYTLQENEFEITNEYLFALTAHVIYWGNRDASLFLAKQLLTHGELPVASHDSCRASNQIMTPVLPKCLLPLSAEVMLDHVATVVVVEEDESSHPQALFVAPRTA